MSGASLVIRPDGPTSVDTLAGLLTRKLGEVDGMDMSAINANTPHSDRLLTRSELRSHLEALLKKIGRWPPRPARPAAASSIVSRTM